jgi:hypothetical protein
VRLTDAAQLAPHRKAGQQPGGINAATRELGIDRTEAQRSTKIDGLTAEAKQAAIETAGNSAINTSRNTTGRQRIAKYAGFLCKVFVAELIKIVVLCKDG